MEKRVEKHSENNFNLESNLQSQHTPELKIRIFMWSFASVLFLFDTCCIKPEHLIIQSSIYLGI